MSSGTMGVKSNGKMRRMISRKSHSWWWDSHISPKNSKWLAENLEEMDRYVKEMLKLIEEEGDSFAKKAEMYYQKRPDLVSHVEDFYRMYRALAERYDHVTGELRKSMQADLHSQRSWSGSDFGSEPPSPSLPSIDRPPELKRTITKHSSRAAGFEFFLGSGGSSQKSIKESDGSSSTSSQSDSDSDDAKDVNDDGDGITSRLEQRILELENELSIVKEKLSEHEKCGQLADENHADLVTKIAELENDCVVANEKLQNSESEISNLQQKLEEKNVSTEAYENMAVSMVETKVDEAVTNVNEHKKEIEDLKGLILSKDQIIDQYQAQIAEESEKFSQEKLILEADILTLKGNIEELKSEVDTISQQIKQAEGRIWMQQNVIEELKATAATSADRFSLEDLKGLMLSKDQIIEQYKAQIAEESEKFSQEKLNLEANIVTLKGNIEELKSEVDTVSQQIKQAEGRISMQQNVIEELTATAATSADRFSLEKSALRSEMAILSQSNYSLSAKLMHLESENTDRERQNCELNQEIDGFRLQVDMLTAEKNELTARISALSDGIKSRDDCICNMEEHMKQLHLEHMKLIEEVEQARRSGRELALRVTQLNEEVERQRVVISDGAEGKREAIRQLCFSLEHYRDGYHHLRQLLQGNNRRPRAVMAA